MPRERERKQVRERRCPEAPCSRVWPSCRGQLPTPQPILGLRLCRRELRRGHLSLRDQLLASEATGRSPWDSGLSRSPEPRRRGPDQGAGSGCVVTAPAWPRGRCPRRPWRTPHPRHGPGPAPGRRAFAARGGVCCFCSQPERERDGCWRRNSGLTSDCCCLGFCFFFWGTLTSFSSRALLC